MAVEIEFEEDCLFLFDSTLFLIGLCLWTLDSSCIELRFLASSNKECCRFLISFFNPTNSLASYGDSVEAKATTAFSFLRPNNPTSIFPITHNSAIALITNTTGWRGYGESESMYILSHCNFGIISWRELSLKLLMKSGSFILWRIVS